MLNKGCHNDEFLILMFNNYPKIRFSLDGVNNVQSCLPRELK